MNPLLKKFDTPFGAAPFSKLSIQHFEEAIPQTIEIAQKEVDNIATLDEVPNFENTIEALEKSGKLLGQATSIFFNLNSAETSDQMQELAQQLAPLLSKYQNDVLLNKELFDRIRKLWQNQESLDLNAEQKMLLKKTYKRFERNGANLDIQQQENLREIDRQLAELSLKFGQNVLKETNAYSLQVKEEEKLEGIPENVLSAAKAEAEKRDLSDWVFTLQYPSYVPFMKYCKNRDLRKEMALAFSSKAFKKNENDNQEIILDIVRLKKERAELLGYKSHADFILEERMAGSVSAVNDFLNRLLSKANVFLKKELEELNAFARAEGISTLQSWDHAFYAEKLRKQKFDLSEEELKVYFPLEGVEKGAFEIAKKLFGIQFRHLSNVDVYHPEVKVYEVLDDQNQHLALLYADYFPREGKRAGAWMTSYRGQYKSQEEEQRPHISIVCNFSKPSENKPSLLSFDEARTLFHEFGHALHGVLANTQYESLSGTHVLWDFVELPSQFMENFCFEPEALELFAKHYETGEVIPQELIKKLKDSSHFLAAYQTVRQISFSLLDMAWHGVWEKKPEDVQNFENSIMDAISVYPKNEQTNMSCSFAHIFQGGYSAGYYSYKWAEVLDADAFSYFKENGVFDESTAKKFKVILQFGGTIEPMALYKSFRGKEPSEDALLKRAGLLI